MYQKVNETFYIFQVTTFFTILKHYKSLNSENKAFRSELEEERIPVLTSWLVISQ